MPTYIYKCTNCCETFEIFHRMNENPDILCPSCNSMTKKIICDSVGIIIKGDSINNINNAEYKYNSKCNQKLRKEQCCCCNDLSLDQSL